MMLYAMPKLQVYNAEQFHGQSGLGDYSYGYKTPESAKVEDRAGSGNVKGSYVYKDGNNELIKVSRHIQTNRRFSISMIDCPNKTFGLIMDLDENRINDLRRQSPLLSNCAKRVVNVTRLYN